MLSGELHTLLREVCKMKTTEKKPKKISWYLPRILTLLLALFGVSFFFMYDDIISRAFQSVAKFETNPGFTGGRVAGVFYDPVGDDHGFGGLLYPTHKDFVAGSLDLVRYTVHEPVYNAQWATFPEYWQLDLSFSSGPNTVRNIRIYIDADRDGAGNTQPRDDMAEGVSFDAASPWDYVVAVHGSDGVIESADGKVKVRLKVTVSNSEKDVSIRIPLADSRLQQFYRVKETAQYVCVGAWTPWGPDGFAPVAQRAASGAGGGSISSLTPKIYDCLVPEGKTQEELLSVWNEDSLDIPVLEPVVVNMHAASGISGKNINSKLVSELEKLAVDEAAKRGASLNEQCDASRDGIEKKGVDAVSAKELSGYGKLLFSAGKRVDAEKIFDRVLAVEPDNPGALGYKGSLVALRGGEASPLAAVDIVADAYHYLDRAVSLASTPEENH